MRRSKLAIFHASGNCSVLVEFEAWGTLLIPYSFHHDFQNVVLGIPKIERF